VYFLASIATDEELRIPIAESSHQLQDSNRKLDEREIGVKESFADLSVIPKKLVRKATSKKLEEEPIGSPEKIVMPLYKLDVKKKMKVKVDLRKNKKEEFRQWYLNQQT
jgi:hypothetical protein